MKHTITFPLLLFLSSFTLSQTSNYPGKIRIIVNDQALIPAPGVEGSDLDFNQILSNYAITDIKQVVPFAKTPELQRLYELNTTLSEESLYADLVALNQQKNLFLTVEKCPMPVLLYDPGDWMWWLLQNDPNNDWLWYLDRIQANLAWDLTKGDANVKVAIIDNGIDANHPDLIGKVSPLNNFMDGSPFPIEGHGTSVATILAAETVDAGMTGNGQISF